MREMGGNPPDPGLAFSLEITWIQGVPKVHANL
jgi:hypothetical protein